MSADPHSGFEALLAADRLAERRIMLAELALLFVLGAILAAVWLS